MEFLKATVEYVDHMGSDLSVVNAARVSFDKHHEIFKQPDDEGLIKYLAREGHWSPFAHTTIQIRVSCCFAIAKQLAKHQVGFAWNEISRRYVDFEPSYFKPTDWRSSSADKKQGSGEALASQTVVDKVYMDAIADANEAYNRLLALGVCAEQARFVMPLGAMTTWYWTGSVYGFARVFNQRSKEGHNAQEEAEDVAKLIVQICNQHFPVSWKYLTGK